VVLTHKKYRKDEKRSIESGFVKTFLELNPDKEPDEIKLTVKVIE